MCSSDNFAIGTKFIWLQKNELDTEMIPNYVLMKRAMQYIHVYHSVLPDVNLPMDQGSVECI
jgi:hypothetical protein